MQSRRAPGGFFFSPPAPQNPPISAAKTNRFKHSLKELQLPIFPQFDLLKAPEAG